MSLGAGKYDPVACAALEAARAEAVVLVVVGGFDGHGFSLAIKAESSFEAATRIEAVAGVMEESIRSMRADAKRMRNAAVGEKS
jgi:hypothetical protein